MSAEPGEHATVELPRGTDSTDAELVRAYLGARQDSAFIQLVRRHQIPVFRKLALDLADPDDAEAVCEAVFVVASQRLSEWQPSEELRDWLFRVADEVRASRQGQPLESDSPRLVDPAVFFKQSVHRALQGLPENERSVLLAVDLEGESIEEVASRRTLPVEEVADLLGRARQRFTEALSTKAEDASKAEAPPRVVPGEVIDKRYLVEALLGEGGMAAVFRAEHLGIKRKVAVKTLHPTRQAQAMIRERFFREAEVLGRLAHPNFVDVSDFGESNRGMAYLVMELLEGRPLSAEIAGSEKVQPARALRILREVCSGLAFAHELGIIHRDIKPDNIVVLYGEPREGFAKILDLGIAATGDELAAPESVIYGTPEYMAPEQIIGGRIDGRVDLYAAGITLFELLTGTVPFSGSTTPFILAQQMTARPPTLAELGEELPEQQALQELLDQCLAKDPTNRVRSALVLRDRIDAVLVRLGTAAGASPAPDIEIARAQGANATGVSPRRRVGVVWVALFLATIGAAALWWFLR